MFIGDIMKKNIYIILELTCIFIITLFYNLICNHLVSTDEIWNYGFSYNIATGLIPYKDFNMVVTPFYPFLGSIFLTIFGKNLIVFHIFNSFICTIIFYFIKKLVPYGYYLVYILLLSISLPNYSLFCLLLLFIIINLENKNDYLIGFFLGITFLTKQNIGIFLCIPSLFTKNFKKIYRKIIGFIIPILILLTYLIITDSLYYFIDYCFLGLFNFAKDNTNIQIYIIITVISILYLIYSYAKNKNIQTLYVLCFQIICYPLFDRYHVFLGFIPVLTLFLSNIKLNKKIIATAFYLFIIVLFSYNIYLIKNGTYEYPNNTKIYKYRLTNKILINNIIEVSKYIKKIDNNLFIINQNSYLLKLEAGLEINKYDLLNNGNLGKNGEDKIINEIDTICTKEQCTFLMYDKEINNSTVSQTNQKIIKYVNKNYNKYGKISGLTIYRNEVK